MKAPDSLPWEQHDYGMGTHIRSTKKPFATALTKANAEYIVHACNAYPRLVGVIGALVADLDRLGFADPDASINGGDLIDLIAARMDDLREVAK